MKIISCDCVHSFQDRRYGLNKRLATLKLSGANVCTACGKVTAIPDKNKKK